MDTIITDAGTTFATTTGFSLASVVEFMTDQVLLIVGTGLGVLQDLMPWIVAIAAISGVVYFLFRAFRFFRH